jgi:hypothetical protein
MTDRGLVERQSAGGSTPDAPARKGWALLAAIGEVLSALDDRNVIPAMRTLEPQGEEGPRCTRCVTRGE